MLSLLVPPALRSLFLVILGIQLFGWTCTVLHNADIELASALNYAWDDDKLLFDVRAAARLGWILYSTCLGSYWILGGSVVAPVAAWITLLGVIFIPHKLFLNDLRQMFVSSLLRCINPFTWSTPTPLSDIILGDILTSYSKILAEWDILIQYYILQPFNPSKNELSYIPSILSVIFICFPFFSRFRQCVSDFIASGATIHVSPGMARMRSMRPLVNAMKYATSFPLIYLSYLLLNPAYSSTFTRSCWLFNVTVNTIFSSAWDVLIDWDLFPPSNRSSLASSKTSQPWHYFYRRQLLLFPSQPMIYSAAIIFDLACRASWMLRFLSLGGLVNLKTILESSNGVFALQTVEIVRRFVWLIFRLEAHAVQQLKINATP